MKKVFLFLFVTLLTTSAFAQVNEAIAYRNQGLLDKAKASIDKAMDNPKQNTKAKTWYTRGSIYQAMSSSPLPTYNKLDSNAISVAYESYMKAAVVEPESKDAKRAQEDAKKILISVAYNKFQHKDYPSSLKYCQDAIAVNSKDTTAALIAAYSSQNIKKYSDAASYYEKYLENGGKGGEEMYQSIIQLYKADKNYDKALAAANKAISKFPKNEDLRKEEIEIYIGSGKSDEAINKMEAAVQRDPKNIVFNQNLAVLYDRKKEYEKAATFYEKSLELDPNSFEMNYNMGVLWFNKGAELSMKVNEESQKLKAGQTHPKTKEMDGYFSKALPYFEKANQIKPNEMDVLTNLSKLYRILKRPEDEKKINKLIESAN